MLIVVNNLIIKYYIVSSEQLFHKLQNLGNYNMQTYLLKIIKLYTFEIENLNSIFKNMFAQFKDVFECMKNMKNMKNEFGIVIILNFTG